MEGEDYIVLNGNRLSEELQVTRRTLRNYVNAGLIPAKKMGTANVYVMTRKQFNFYKEVFGQVKDIRYKRPLLEVMLNQDN